jgi:hypothetical protein
MILKEQSIAKENVYWAVVMVELYEVNHGFFII